ncbi:MAG: hypothetical protein SNH79_00665 [Rikenellaceae bacterium]
MAESNKAAFANIVEHVEKRVDMLMADHSRIAELNKKLTAELTEARATKRELQQQLNTLKIERDKLALQDGISAVVQDPKRAAAYVTRLLHEVDECLRLVAAVKTTAPAADVQE